MQQATNTTTPGAIDFLGDVFSNASTLPEDLREFAEKLNNDLINLAKGVDAEKQKTADEIEENLTQGKFQEFASSTLEWLQEPSNLLVSFVAFVAFVILVRKL